MKKKSFFGGFFIGTLGGLIGLGGAEFRLPFLVGVLKIATLSAIMINIIVSLATVSSALIFRGINSSVLGHYDIVLNLLCGTLVGAWFGASLATKIDKNKLDKYILVLLVFLSLLMFSHAFFDFKVDYGLAHGMKIALGLLCGLFIGVVSSMLGVAGGELIIPTIILLYGVDIKLAGTLSLIISIPTLLIGMYRYYANGKLDTIVSFKDVVVVLIVASIAGAFVGALFFGVMNPMYLEIILSIILMVSAIKIFNKNTKGINV